MAKFGEPKAEYDPFSAISDSLAVLGEDTVKKSEEPAPRKVDETETAARPARPVVSSPEPEPIKSSGGGQDPQSEPVTSRAEPAKPKKSTTPVLTEVKRYKTTREEAIRIDRATVNLAAELGVRMDASKITRALWETYLTHEQEILRSAKLAEGLSHRPSHHDPVAMAEFDEKIAALISEALMLACMRSHRG